MYFDRKENFKISTAGLCCHLEHFVSHSFVIFSLHVHGKINSIAFALHVHVKVSNAIVCPIKTCSSHSDFIEKILECS